MVTVRVDMAPGAYRLTIEGHANADDATCAAVTALEQAFAITLEQLASMRPDQIEFKIYALEALP